MRTLYYAVILVTTLAGCAGNPDPPPALPNIGACTLASVAARNTCPMGQPANAACVAASLRAAEACRPI